MEWLEIIELRTVDGNQELLKSQLQKLVSELDMETKKRSIKSYCRVMVHTDFSIHLSHDSTVVENGGSRLGLHLVSILREFGLVSHSIWIEMHNK